MEFDPKTYSVSIKEYFDKQLDHLENTIRIADEAHQRALKIETDEVARRLAVLNGEADHLVKMQATYLPREVYDTSQKEIFSKLDELKKVIDGLVSHVDFKRLEDQISVLQLFNANLKGKADQSSVNWLALVAIISIVISVAKLFIK